MAVRLRKGITVYKALKPIGVDHYSRKKIVAILRLRKGTLVNYAIRSKSAIEEHGDRKNRAASARVIEIRLVKGDYTAPDGWRLKRHLAKRRSLHSRTFIYRPGEMVRPTSPFDHSRDDCAPGIHFFQTLDAAARYA